MNSIESNFVPYQIALDMKSIGFDEPCFAYYKDMKGEKVLLYDSMDFDGECSAPLYQQCFRFFREKYNASPLITCYSELGNAWKYHIPNEGGEQGFNTYEEAELECLKKLIEIVKDENKRL